MGRYAPAMNSTFPEEEPVLDETPFGRKIASDKQEIASDKQGMPALLKS